MVYDPLIFLSGRLNFLRQLGFQEKNLDEITRLDVVEIARVNLHASYHPL